MASFKVKLAPHLGQDFTDTQLQQLFMKIDADCGGTVDWYYTDSPANSLVLP